MSFWGSILGSKILRINLKKPHRKNPDKRYTFFNYFNLFCNKSGINTFNIYRGINASLIRLTSVTLFKDLTYFFINNLIANFV